MFVFFGSRGQALWNGKRNFGKEQLGSPLMFALMYKELTLQPFKLAGTSDITKERQDMKHICHQIVAECPDSCESLTFNIHS